MNQEDIRTQELYDVHKRILSTYAAKPIDVHLLHEHPLHGQAIEDEMTSILQKLSDKEDYDKEQIDRLELV